MKIGIKEILIGIGTLLVGVWIYFPLFFMFVSAFKDNGAIFSYPPSLIFKPSLGAFLDAISPSSKGAVGGLGLRWGDYFLNSTIVALGGAGFALLLGVPVAFALAHLNIPNKYRLAFSFLTIRMLPPIVVMLPIFIMFSAIGLLDTYPSLIIEYVVFGLPWVVWLMWSFFEAIPHSIFEAAQLDGASHLTILLRVLLPLAKGGLIVSAVFSFIQGYNDFIISFIIGGSKTETLPLALSVTLSERLLLWNTIFAVGVLNLIPTVILVFLVRKHWARGLTLGLVK